MPSGRRGFLTALGAAAGLSGCLAGPSGRRGRAADRTLYVGSYHWGFVLLDENGDEHDRVVIDRDATVRLVAFDTGAERALDELPATVRDAVPGHHELEERNEDRMPSPRGGDMHEFLEAANERYPDHSVAVMPSGGNHVGGMWSGMMLHPLAVRHDARRPVTAILTAGRRGDYTISCTTYCGYGHPYMDLDGALVVR